MAKHLKCIKKFHNIKNVYRKEILYDILRECYHNHD